MIWKDFYREIAERIQENIPQILHIDLWHDQVSFLSEEHPFPSPAAFIAFTTLGTADKGELTQLIGVQVDVYLFWETFSDTYQGAIMQEEALGFLELLTRINALFHGKHTLSCSSMRKTGLTRMESGGSGNLYRITFETEVHDYSAQEMFVELEDPKKELEILLAEGIRKPKAEEDGFII